MQPQMPTQAQLVNGAKTELAMLAPKITVCEALVPKLQIAANRLHEDLGKGEEKLFDHDLVTSQALMVLVEAKLVEETLRLEEMRTRATALTAYIENADRSVILPGLGSKS